MNLLAADAGMIFTLLKTYFLHSNRIRERKINMNIKSEKVPINQKLTLTIREAAEYSNIGINKIESMLRTPNCPFVLYVGSKKLVKRKEFENFLSKMNCI